MLLVETKILKSAKSFWTLFLDLIFPVECLGCGREGIWLCAPCFQKLKFRRLQYCLSCKKENHFGEFCPECRKEYHLDGCLIAGSYDQDEFLSSLVKSFKYKFIRDLGPELGRFLRLFLKDTESKASMFGWGVKRNLFFGGREFLVVPIPLHRRRLRWRGFNQAEILAREAFGERVEQGAGKLVRAKYTRPQVKLSESERAVNIKNCFVWEGENLAGRNIVLIDDVVTTGATLNEAARVLKENGAGKVWGLVVAKG